MDQQELIKDYIARKNMNEILNKFNISKSTLYRILDKNNINTRFKNPRKIDLNCDLKNKIIYLYSIGNDIKKIALAIGCDSGKISNFLQQNNFEVCGNKQYNVDLGFFEKIDSEDKAHVLGLLYTDGSNNGKGFTINSIDKDCIEKIKEKLKYTGPISIIKPKGRSKKDQYHLSIRRMKISQDLSKLGCIKKKSLVLKFPSNNIVPIEFIKSFILGVLEGDGCIAKNSVSFHGTYDMMIGIKNFIKENLNIELTLYKQRNIFALYSNKKKESQMLLNWLYQNAEVYMNRKYDKYITLYGRTTYAQDE